MDALLASLFYCSRFFWLFLLHRDASNDPCVVLLYSHSYYWLLCTECFWYVIDQKRNV